MVNLWHLVIHSLSTGLITLEERKLVEEEARRLKIKTDLQEARIQALLEKKKVKEQKKKESENYWVLLAVVKYKHRHRQNERTEFKSVYSIFNMEYNPATKHRQISAGSMVGADNGQVVGKAGFDDFIKSRPIWYEKMKPWLDGTKTLKEIKCDEITVVGEISAKKNK